MLDNGHYGETGMQQSHAGRGIELSRMAAAANFPWTGTVTDMAGVAELRARMHQRAGTSFATVKIDVGEVSRVLPPRDGVYVKNRFPQRARSSDNLTAAVKRPDSFGGSR